MRRGDLPATLERLLNERFDLSVRKARLGDAAALAKIFRESWRQAYTGIIPALHLEQELLRRNTVWWARAVEAEKHLLILMHGDQAAGYASCGPSRGAGRETGEIYELYLAPQYQGCGLGQHLFEACRATLDGLDLRHLIVWALLQNEAAKAFYRRCGGRATRRSCVRLGYTVNVRIAFEW